ncbi:hypothetical protein [Streptomyces virginiae]|uniref:hypothetical protein n=1 Tax=Streptomyces virginiae TaxID=1961 RepID=UPI00224E5EB3|nr:hypothetical protein [Streptomyces virginiae]MCX5278424.1 hypothetical protein [Streptomyces virginiae]
MKPSLPAAGQAAMYLAVLRPVAVPVSALNAAVVLLEDFARSCGDKEMSRISEDVAALLRETVDEPLSRPQATPRSYLPSTRTGSFMDPDE